MRGGKRGKESVGSREGKEKEKEKEKVGGGEGGGKGDQGAPSLLTDSDDILIEHN